MNPVLYRLVSGMPSIQDADDDGAPLVSFHNMRPGVAMRLAKRMLLGLELCDKAEKIALDLKEVDEAALVQ